VIEWEIFVPGLEPTRLTWRDGRVVVMEQGGPAPDLGERLDVFDPRVTDFRQILPRGSAYDADLWLSQWVQERRIMGIEAELETRGLDWSQELPPEQPGVLY